MENEKPDCQDILKRVYTTPSILFLGQNYLSEVTSEYSKNTDQAQLLLDYREILSLRWNTIVSSSFDANIPDKCGESFSLDPRLKYDKSQEISKTIKTGYFLFGQSSNGKIPPKPDSELDSSSKDMFSAVLKKTIDSYGIVIISGWDLDADWITPQDLYNILKDAPVQSVLFFGLERKKALENKFIKALIDKKQLLEKDIIEDAFYIFLQQNGFFDTHLEEDNFSLDPNVERLSLYSNNYKNGRTPFVLKIQKDTIYEFNSKSITLITDTTGVHPVSINNDNLLRFCACKGDWSYYAPHNKLIINRKATIENSTYDFYEYITKVIEKIFKKGKKKNNQCICVSGIHYSGKTALLKNFALRNRNNYPIFYVENYVDGATEKLLKDFCINSINIPEEFLKEREIVIICDFKATSDNEMQRICQKIKNTLSEISGLCPVVIGTTYSNYEFYKKQFKIVPLPHQLSDEESGKLKSIYGVDPNFRLSSSDDSIFQIISRHYRFVFSPEVADLRKKMKNAHSVNQTSNQSTVRDAYGQIYEEENNIIIKLGILSSFNDSLDKNDVLKGNLKKLNDCIALASEFGIELPNNFIFRTLGWNNYKFLEALNADCFLIQKENSFRYISAFEAGKYLLFNYTDDSDSTQIKEKKLKEKEVEILCTIIEICNWNDYNEASEVISLIRKFSPNSIGKDANIIGNEDTNLHQQGRNWHYYDEYYEQVGMKILESADNNNSIAVIVAAAFLRRAYQQTSNKCDKKDLIFTAYSYCKEILDNHTVFESLSINEKVEVYIEICNVIITTFPTRDKPISGNFDKWDEFTKLFHCLVEFYDKTDKLDASVILNTWHRAVIKRAKKQDIALFEQTISYESVFLPDIKSDNEFNEAVKYYEEICNIYVETFNIDNYKKLNLKGWLLYQQRNSYKLELNDHILGMSEKILAKQILSIFDESEEVKSSVLDQPLLLKTKILCDWIVKFNSLPLAEEKPISFTDTIFWQNILKNINAYLALCDEKNPPAASIKYIKCVYSLIFDDGSYYFEENVRYSKKLFPWYVKRIGIADENGKLLKFIIGTIPQRDRENFRGKISDDTSIFRNLNSIHLSADVQKYLSEGRIQLTAMNSIPEKPVNIFFNAAGATAAIPRKEGGDNE